MIYRVHLCGKNPYFILHSITKQGDKKQLISLKINDSHFKLRST